MTLGPGSEGLAAAVHEMMEGWPAATALALATLRDRAPPDRLAAVGTISSAGGPLFAYLAEEVLTQESGEVRTLLRTVSLFDRFKSASSGPNDARPGYGLRVGSGGALTPSVTTAAISSVPCSPRNT